MPSTQPTPAQWLRLIEAAQAFKALAPWRWMDDAQLFGVVDPVSGETGYCCVMGNAGEHFALGVYRGARGYYGFDQVARGAVKDMGGLLALQDCLKASFENRHELDQRYKDLYKELGVKFRKDELWPQFQSFEPGKMPWFITADEAAWLTVALEQALVVCEHVRVQPELLRSNWPQVLVRRPAARGQTAAWTEKWEDPEVEDRLPPVAPTPDLARLAHLQAARLPRRGIWEVSYSQSLTPIMDAERPYFPKMILVADRASCFVLKVEIHHDTDAAAFQNDFLDAIETNHLLPERVCVNERDTAIFLEPIAGALGFTVDFDEHLDVIEEIRTSLHESMSAGNGAELK
jgi:hypothetical protein